MRLVSTVELMVIRERVHNDLAPFEGPVDDNTFEIIHRANAEFSKWYEYWDHYFAAVFEDNSKFTYPSFLEELTYFNSLLSTEFTDAAFPR